MQRPNSPLMKPHLSSPDQDFYLDLHQIPHTHKFHSTKTWLILFHLDPWIILWEINDIVEKHPISPHQHLMGSSKFHVNLSSSFCAVLQSN